MVQLRACRNSPAIPQQAGVRLFLATVRGRDFDFAQGREIRVLLCLMTIDFIAIAAGPGAGRRRVQCQSDDLMIREASLPGARPRRLRQMARRRSDHQFGALVHALWAGTYRTRILLLAFAIAAVICATALG